MTRPDTLRDRIVAAAAATTVASGWSAVSMAGLAQAVGVSRQTVYNEVGAKPELATAVVLDELAGFLAVVEAAFDRFPDDTAAGVERAVRDVLVRAQTSPLLRAIVSASHGADSDLLPLLTTNAEPLLDAARIVVAARLTDVPVEKTRTVIADVLVRVVLSHVMAPSAPPARTARDVGWTYRQLSA